MAGAQRLRGVLRTLLAVLQAPWALVRAVADYARLQRHLYRTPPDRVRALQRRALRRLLRHARRRCPFYRDLYRGLGDDAVLDGITLLAAPGSPQAEAPPSPALAATTIDKAVFMVNFDGINAAGLRIAEAMPWAVARERSKEWLGYYRNRYVLGLSSGTSGNKGLYVTPRSLTERLPAVFLARGGVSLRMLPLRILFLLRVFSQGFADIRAPGLSLRYLSTMTPPEKIAAQALADRTNVLAAPPSLLRILLPHAEALRGTIRRVICYAEVLEDADRVRFEEAFGAPVVQIYQASEGQIASPCRLGSLHVNEDLALVELYRDDGRPATRPGETASTMLVTNLVNAAQPILRYRMNDRVELGEPCACGSSFRVLRRVLGRNDDVLVLRRTTPDPATGADTRPVFPDLVSRWIITVDDAIREFRVAALSPDAVEVALDPMPGTPPEAAERVRAETARRLREELAAYDVAVRRLSVRLAPIPLPEAAQKYRRFVALSPRQALDRALARIARAFAAAGVPFGVCSSMLLALRGLPVEPRDLDLLVPDAAFAAAREALRSLGADEAPERAGPVAVYGSRRFAEFELDGVEVDLMAGLSVFGAHGEYRYELEEGTVDRTVPAAEPAALAEAGAPPALLPLTALEDWFVLYQLIPGRIAKADLIERALRADPPAGAARDEAVRRLAAALVRPLPPETAARVRALAEALRNADAIADATVGAEAGPPGGVRGNA